MRTCPVLKVRGGKSMGGRVVSYLGRGVFENLRAKLIKVDREKEKQRAKCWTTVVACSTRSSMFQVIGS